MVILVSRSMLLRSRNPVEPFVLPMALTFQVHDLCELTFLAVSQLLLGETLPTMNLMVQFTLTNDLDRSRL